MMKRQKYMQLFLLLLSLCITSCYNFDELEEYSYNLVGEEVAKPYILNCFQEINSVADPAGFNALSTLTDTLSQYTSDDDSFLVEQVQQMLQSFLIGNVNVIARPNFFYQSKAGVYEAGANHVLYKVEDRANEIVLRFNEQTQACLQWSEDGNDNTAANNRSIYFSMQAPGVDMTVNRTLKPGTSNGTTETLHLTSCNTYNDYQLNEISEITDSVYNYSSTLSFSDKTLATISAKAIAESLLDFMKQKDGATPVFKDLDSNVNLYDRLFITYKYVDIAKEMNNPVIFFDDLEHIFLTPKEYIKDYNLWISKMSAFLISNMENEKLCKSSYYRLIYEYGEEQLVIQEQSLTWDGVNIQAFTSFEKEYNDMNLLMHLRLLLDMDLRFYDILNE